MKCVCAFALALVLGTAAAAQEPPSVQSSVSPITEVTILSQPAHLAPDRLFVDRDTLIRLMVVNEVTTKTAKVGDRFLLRVDEPVMVEGVTIIPVGTKAWGEVVSAEESGVVGKSGKLGARLISLETASGPIPLRGDNAAAGAGGTGETIMGVIGLGPLGLLARGNNAKLKAGEIFNGYLVADWIYSKTDQRLAAAPSPGTPLPIGSQ